MQGGFRMEVVGVSGIVKSGSGAKENLWRYVSGFFTVLFTGTRVHVTVKTPIVLMMLRFILRRG